MQKIAEGAEASIYLDDGTIIKSRAPKSYRIKEIDGPLRKARTRREAKVMEKLGSLGPRLIRMDDYEMAIKMENIPGKKVRDILENSDYRKICKEIGAKVRKMHDLGIIHGDLTTSNMIFSGNVRFIDFGLSFFSEKDEDKAVDLHLLRQALESKHHAIWEEAFDSALKGYGGGPVLDRLEKVEQRGRNKQKH